MRVDILDLMLEHWDDPVNLVVYSDPHVESPECDRRLMMADMRKSAELQNALFLNLGDFFNGIMPSDTKRYMASENLPDTAGRDDMIDHIVKKAVLDFGRYPWALVAQGNHELHMLQHYYTDMTKRFASKLALPGFVSSKTGIVPHGSYSGFLKLRFFYKSRGRKSPVSSLDIAYTHGGWAGETAQQKAKHWAGWMQGARLFLYGHNHNTAADPISWFRSSKTGRLLDESGIVAGCGTFMRTYSEKRTTYNERKARRPSFLGSQRFTLQLEHRGSNNIVVGIEQRTKI